MYFGFEDIIVNYGKKNILDNITLDIPKGKIVTIIGQNGCGKSSLLKLIAKKGKAKGNIILKEKNINEFKSKERAKQIAYLPQVHSSPDDIDVKTLVSYGRYPHLKFARGMTLKDKEIVERAMKSAGILHLQNQIVNTLSGGERQRAWIAMSICQEPEILILDEPTTYLDVCYQIEVLELVKSLNREYQMTIVMVLHDLNLASKYSDLLYVIKDKNLYLKGTPDEIMTKENLANIFNIDVTIHNEGYPYFIPNGIVKG